MERGSIKSGCYIQCFSLADDRKLTLEQGKRLAAEMLKMTLDLGLSTPIYERYFKELKADYQTYTNSSTMQRAAAKVPERVTPDLFGFKVGFWDENVDRPLYPYLAQIRAAAGKVYFYYADPKTQALQEPPAEALTFDELLTYPTL